MLTWLLLLSVPALWIHRNLGLFLFTAALFKGYFHGYASALGVIFLITFGLLAYLYQTTSNHKKNVLWWILFILSLSLGFHLIPGFQGWIVIEPVQIGEGATYEKWISFDKFSAAFLIAALALPNLLRKPDWYELIKPWWIYLITLVMVFALGGWSEYIVWDPKWTELFFIWALLNIVTCFTEEVFFRGYIQGELAQKLSPYRHGHHLAIWIAALLFGLAHIGGGVLYVGLASIAGLGYGYVYYRSKRIEASILLHFMVNSTHFLLFSYPASK